MTSARSTKSYSRPNAKSNGLNPACAGVVEDVIAFCHYLRAECGLAENTSASYRRDLVRFARWFCDAGCSELGQLTLTDLAKYVSFLSREKLAPASMARHVVSLKMFYRFLVLEGKVSESAAELLSSPSLWQRVPTVLSAEQVDKLLTAPGPNDRFRARDRALLETLYATGCRVSEVAALELNDVKLEYGLCQCTGKGDKQRLVPLGKKACEALRDYMECQRRELTRRNPAAPCVFVNRLGSRLSRVMIWILVKKYALRAGLPSRVSHTLCATALRPICSPEEPTCAWCRRCWVIPILPRHNSILTSIARGYGLSTTSSILERETSSPVSPDLG